ncbi:MAG TPA: ATP-binding protein, partial [Acidimicrobiales bacterium]
AGDPSSLGLSATTIGLLAGGLVLALGAAATRMWMRRRLRQQEVDTRRAARQVALIREVAPLLQQSLDLADVLPAVAVQLSDHFGLTGVRLSAGSTSAGQVELFALGDAPRPTVPVLTPPDRLAAGESLTLALQRAGRSVALLHVVAGRTLGESDLQSLRTITELVTAAVVNASLFASQQEAVARLRELDVLKTVFLSTASHELRTPATAIGGFATLLTASWDRFDDERRREFADRIAANARSLNAVVQDLLDFSLLDRGGVSVVLEAVAAGPLVTGVVERLGPALPDHTVELSVGDAPEVAADVNALERVVTNLLTNAAKFSPAGSTISVAVQSRGGGAEITVSDQGPGVPIEERARVFTRFYRGSGDAVTRTRGVGIGLSVVAELVERMGGNVAIDDAPGGGARFRVSLVPAATMAEIPEVRGATTT